LGQPEHDVIVGDMEWTLLEVIVGAVTITATCVFSGLCKRRRRRSCASAYTRRDFIAYEDLVDQNIRADHLTFNAHLHHRFKGQRFLPVCGENSCFIAFDYSTCRDIMNDHVSFSSNPFPDNRLVALNTMAKADHSRVLRFVHSHYTSQQLEELENRIKGIIEECTDDLEGDNTDVMVWAKRIHMTSTLLRLGLERDPRRNWADVDEKIALNDAMVALVAPLGGIGMKYEELPWGQSLRVAFGVVCSVPAMLELLWQVGFRCIWDIIRPDVTLLWLPQAPRMGLWWRPELLPLVPRYFLWLHQLLSGRSPDGPLPGIQQGLEKGQLKMAEVLTLLVQLMVNMTSANALGSLVFRLANERDAAACLSAEPERFAAAFVQEVLRLDTPLQRNPRRVVQVGRRWEGCPLKPGDHVLVFLGAANMDPAVFEEPEAFRLNREGKDSQPGLLSFGSGIHYCLGSSLVKLEMRLALDCLLRRFSSVELSQYNRLVDVDVGNWGFSELRVRVQPRK